MDDPNDAPRKTDIVAPRRTQFLKDKDEPNSAIPRSDMEEQSLAIPTIENVEPRRVYTLIETADPNKE